LLSKDSFNKNIAKILENALHSLVFLFTMADFGAPAAERLV